MSDSTRTALVLVLVACGGLAAGCARTDVEGPADAATARPQRPPDGVATVEAPAWRAGDRWNHSIVDANGTVHGWRSAEVVGAVNVSGTYAHVLVERVGLPDHGPGPWMRMYEAATLNEVWDFCGRGWAPDNCQGRVPFYDFPLWDGKRWETCYEEGGDVCVTVQAESRPVGPVDVEALDATGLDAWQITWRSSTVNEGWRTEAVYVPALGIVVGRQEVAPDGTVTGRWVLATTNRIPAA